MCINPFKYFIIVRGILGLAPYRRWVGVLGMVLDSSELRYMHVYYDNQAPRRDVVFVIYAYDARKGLKFAAILN